MSENLLPVFKVKEIKNKIKFEIKGVRKNLKVNCLQMAFFHFLNINNYPRFNKNCIRIFCK